MRVVVVSLSIAAVVFTAGMLFGISILPAPKPRIVHVYYLQTTPAPPPTEGSGPA